VSTHQPKVFVVTPVFNQKDHTDTFLNSFKQQAYHNFEVIIIDDGSTDGTSEMIAEKYPETIVIKGNGSLWWSGGTNLGVVYAENHDGDYVLTINNDLEIADDYLQILIDLATKNPKTLIGSLVVYENDPKKVWYAGAYHNKERGEMQHITGVIMDFTEPTHTTEWLAGMGVLVPIEAYAAAGLYDEKYFPQYFGDCEFSIRAKQKGFKLLVSTKAVVTSDVESSWVYRQIQKPKLRMFYDLFFSIRSPYQIGTRWNYYRMYWGKTWWWSLIKLYGWTMRGVYYRFTVAFIKSLVRAS
jgi:GT2 family glycosyltransferase